MKRPARLLFLPALLLLCAFPAPPALCQGQGGQDPPADDLSLQLKLERSRAYPGEEVPVTITLLVGDGQVRNIHYPRLPKGRYRAAPFGLPRERQTVLEGADCTAYDFSTTVTPLGREAVELGPAEVRCDLLARAGGADAFFGATEPRAVLVRSEGARLEVLPFPARGRSAGFKGVVGRRFTVTRSARPAEVRVGDPVTLRTVIGGEGNFSTVSCDPIAAEGFTSYPPRAVAVGASVACEQVVIPRSVSVREIPPFALHYFDPGAASYRVATGPALPLRVAQAPPPATVAPAPTRPAPTPSPLRFPLVPCIILTALAGGAVVVALRRPPPRSVERRAERTVADDLAAADAALAKGDAEHFYTTIFRALQRVAGDATGRPPAGITSPISERDEDSSAVAELVALFARCDGVRYGKERPTAAEMAGDLHKMHELSASDTRKG